MLKLLREIAIKVAFCCKIPNFYTVKWKHNSELPFEFLLLFLTPAQEHISLRL